MTHPFGDIINLVCFYNEKNGFGTAYTDPWVAEVTTNEVIDHYRDWEPALVEVISVGNLSLWSLQIVIITTTDDSSTESVGHTCC